ncbi:uncharacterized protein SPAPADRAFT_142833 [Spathaspora passalidarum NRRL Y-27907]|uniref:Crh-like protein n=1 Tax=Spathaspora passalidarum (strain NRRL Y-27907 / 11-Y1) TaxID=619300 RepID=G3ASQ2_SPAPN|nr:uncharacterized protein SPAPADRAFT_142833 [Spathaspora passalidarum NRRL Y-27907]EGW31116.1 hypothetical protein SPAPADRAFT_142833 [Spathaspora passalidarum NRRL Y-27907]
MIKLNFLLVFILSILSVTSLDSDDDSDDSDLELERCNPLTDNQCLVTNEALGTSIFESFQTGTRYFAITSSRNRIMFDPNGLQLTIKKEFDNPSLVSSFYIMYGKVEAEIKGAHGRGIISSFYLQSDDLDEIDIVEVFGGDPYEYQTNYFVKGNTTNYDRGRYHSLATSPLTEFHKYGMEWTPHKITWFLDGKKVRVLNKKNKYGFPCSPSFLKFSLWAGGDYSNDEGTITWAGGPTNYDEGPFTMTIRNLNVTDYSNGVAYSYGNLSGGKWLDLQANGGEIYDEEDEDPESPTKTSTIPKTKTKTKVPKSQLLEKTTRKKTTVATNNLYQLPKVTEFKSDGAVPASTTKTKALYTTTVSITELLDQDVVHSSRPSAYSTSWYNTLPNTNNSTSEYKFVQDVTEEEEDLISGVSQIDSIPIAVIVVIISVVTWL